MTRIGDMPGESEARMRPRLLVIDDLEDNRIILGRRLARRGYEVVEAANGDEALARLARERFDLVLLDIVMPGLDGFQVLEAIRADFDPLVLPVIMVTVRDGGADIVRALQLGANDYLTKPIDFEVAHARVEAQILRKLAVEAGRGVGPAFRAAAELEARLHQAEAASRAKSELLELLGQEVQGPLRQILAQAAGLGGDPDEQQRRHMTAALNKAVAALEDLLTAALDLPPSSATPAPGAAPSTGAPSRP